MEGPLSSLFVLIPIANSTLSTTYTDEEQCGTSGNFVHILLLWGLSVYSLRG